MNHYFNNIDIPFSIGGCNFHAVNIISSSIDTDIPLHTHGVNCYEIHFISNGCGRLIADGNEYDISTNTLYVTGPLCDHAQLTDKPRLCMNCAFTCVLNRITAKDPTF